MAIAAQVRILFLLSLPALLAPRGVSLSFCFCPDLLDSCCVPCCGEGLAVGVQSNPDPSQPIDCTGCEDCRNFEVDDLEAFCHDGTPDLTNLRVGWCQRGPCVTPPGPAVLPEIGTRAPPRCTPLALLSSVRPMRN